MKIICEHCRSDLQVVCWECSPARMFDSIQAADVHHDGTGHGYRVYTQGGFIDVPAVRQPQEGRKA
jgi:hypothetical protein